MKKKFFEIEFVPYTIKEQIEKEKIGILKIKFQKEYIKFKSMFSTENIEKREISNSKKDGFYNINRKLSDFLYKKFDIYNFNKLFSIIENNIEIIIKEKKEIENVLDVAKKITQEVYNLNLIYRYKKRYEIYLSTKTKKVNKKIEKIKED